MTDTATARARLSAIINEKSFFRGHIVLASGQESDHYFDMKPTMLDPEAAELLAALIMEEILPFKPDIVGGIEMGAIPLITPVSIAARYKGHNIPGFFVRKQPKDHGTKKVIDGIADVSGLTVAIVEDVTTTGGSAMKAVKALQEAGAKVGVVATIVDREGGAAKIYAEAGIPFVSLFKSSEFLNG